MECIDIINYLTETVKKEILKKVVITNIPFKFKIELWKVNFT